MNIEQNQIRELMQRLGQATPEKPLMPSAEIRKQRIGFHAEELLELCDAFNIALEISNGEVKITERNSALVPDIILAYDAVIDEIVFAIGTAVAMGCQLQPGWDEVQRSNSTKTAAGKNKWIKGPNYSPPNLQRIIQQQLSK